MGVREAASTVAKGTPVAIGVSGTRTTREPVGLRWVFWGFGQSALSWFFFLPIGNRGSD